MKKATYTPPYTITSETVRLVSEISETLGRFSAMDQMNQTPMLRRGNRLRTIQASLAIENSSLTLEQVTSIINESTLKRLKWQKIEKIVTNL